MSKLKGQQPIIHIPSFNKYEASRFEVTQKLQGLGLEPLYPDGVHGGYFYTDVEGAVKLLPNLIMASDLYKTKIFTCINYAFRVWNECSRRYDLNTWLPVIGRIPNYEPRHAWNLLLIGDEDGINLDLCLYFEPNDGWEMGTELEAAYQAFPIGEEGYRGEMVFY